MSQVTNPPEAAAFARDWLRVGGQLAKRALLRAHETVTSIERSCSASGRWPAGITRKGCVESRKILASALDRLEVTS
jgi:hypothetical protein